jgi:hypothetical protein
MASGCPLADQNRLPPVEPAARVRPAGNFPLSGGQQARSGRSARPAEVYWSRPARSSAQSPEEHDCVVGGGVG